MCGSFLRAEDAEQSSAPQPMKTTTPLFLFASAFAVFCTNAISAATVPAGTTLVVKTLDVLSSNESPGRQFHAVLARDVAAHNRLMLPAGTKVLGKIATSQRMEASRERLTVNLTDVRVGGRTLPIKTTGAVKVENYTGSRGTAFSHGYYHVAKGRVLQFTLAQSLQL